ncbi:C4-dicarboxylate ABC transporter substrate-binding protein [Halomonas eurihalina]|uniref:C4-dicarboxylate ABC transporter substrate-binding protein n=1 Tax=Halomonas eurihalina TaxID=42566 RepID=A0A5D9D8A6_HALER|nr:TRAP transporter substrate-binding protein DctP [Halomonas eurihalina]MDR5860012.1 TRAP transporter substrate-binding protein DctP [Halomonas eurihalina]TZG39809.1 C4-dicarboxylate ABC transporter substrate-binding protein [Halomonas eurihalina]
MKTMTWFSTALVTAVFASQTLAADIEWRVPTSVPDGSPFFENFLERFADNAALLTEGKVEIQPFGAGVIVPALQVYDAVKEGTVDAGHSTPSYLVNQNPVNAIFAGFPGGMGPQAYINWIYEGGGQEKLQELRASEGLHSLIVGIGSTEIFAHSNVPINGPEDLKGLKYRTSGPWAEVMREYYDAVPTVVPPGDTYTLLQRKGVDAVEWATPSSNQPEGFHEAARYIVVPGVHQPTFLWEVVVRQETWDQLPDGLKPLLEAAAKLTTYEGLGNFYHQDMLAMEKYRAGKNEVISLDEEFIKELSDNGRAWIAGRAEEASQSGNSRMAEILEEYQAYQKRWNAQKDYLITD